jgi:hypothetical protein
VAPPKKKGGCGKWLLLLLLLLLALCIILGAVGGVIYWKKGDVIREKLRGGELQSITAEEWAREFGQQAGSETPAPAPSADPELERIQRALADMGLVAAALENYRNDLGRYPNPGSNPDSYYSLVDLSAVMAELSPYGSGLPSSDPWGSPYEYGSTQDSQSYVLICKGSDGMNKLEKIPEAPVENRCFEEEIVLEKGTFVQQPASDARSCGGE